MKPHESLEAWKRCHGLTLTVYRVTQSFPKTELYGITSQMRRAAVSAAANLVEGCAKRGVRDFRRFIDIAIGSLAEVSYYVLLAKDLGYLSIEDWNQVHKAGEEAGRTTMGLYKSISHRVNAGQHRLTD
ncbi:MAG TPA: four helix bundle protein [Gemmatimonadales bacterium]|nr:four helix bundle protein [Gemmatimonadales bacterium]